MAASSTTRLRTLVRRFRGKRVAVVGDLMLDRFIRGRVGRISPEAPVPVVEVNQPETVHLGGAGNVAANLAALGARPMVVGVVGSDTPAQEIRRELARLRIGATGLLRDPSRATTVKTRIIADHQHVVRADWEQAEPLAPRVERQLLAAFRRLASQFSGVILSDYDKGVLTESLLEELLGICARRRLPIFADLKKERSLDRGVTLLLVNKNRAEEIAGRVISDNRSLELIGRHLMARFPCSTLIITLGEKGMAVLEKGRVKLAPTQPTEVFDVTGAGDTAIAALALALISGGTPLEAATLANAAAGIVVAKLGTATCTSKELLVTVGINRPRR